MRQLFAEEKLKPLLIKLAMPLFGELENTLVMKPLLSLKNIMFKPSQYYIMRLDNLENLKALPTVTDYHVRTYRSGDERAWVQLIKRSFGQYFPDKVAEICRNKEFDPNGCFFLKHDHEFVGTVYAMQTQFQGVKTGCIHRLCVVPEHRGKRLGHFLALYALNYFRKTGLQSAMLDVNENNDAAIKTYASLGFKPI